MALAVGFAARLGHRVGDTAGDQDDDHEQPGEIARLGKATAEREPVPDPFAGRHFGQTILAPAAALLPLLRRLALGGARLLELAQLLGPLGGDGRGRLLALGIALGRRPCPLAQPAEVASLGEGEQREDGESEERDQARVGPDFLDQFTQGEARGYPS